MVKVCYLYIIIIEKLPGLRPTACQSPSNHSPTTGSQSSVPCSWFPGVEDSKNLRSGHLGMVSWRDPGASNSDGFPLRQTAETDLLAVQKTIPKAQETSSKAPKTMPKQPQELQKRPRTQKRVQKYSITIPITLYPLHLTLYTSHFTLYTFTHRTLHFTLRLYPSIQPSGLREAIK